MFLWNARGLSLDKLELLPTLSIHAHIILITETWQEPGSEFCLPGYTCFSIPKHFQHHRARRPSGGIAAFVRHDAAPHVSRWRRMEECTHMWLHISSRLGLQRDLFLCLCYIPPQNSTYYTQVAEHPLEVITREVHAAAAQGNVLLAGDFNARTGIAPDWLACPDFADLQALLEGMPTEAMPVPM